MQGRGKGVYRDRDMGRGGSRGRGEGSCRFIFSTFFLASQCTQEAGKPDPVQGKFSPTPREFFV